MAVVDTQVIDWKAGYPGIDTNTPTQATVVGTFVDDEIRNIKHVVREENFTGEYLRPGIRSVGTPYSLNRISSTQFSTNYPSSAFNYGRSLGAMDNAGVLMPVVCGSITGGGLGTIITLAPNLAANLLPAVLSEIYIGAYKPGGPALVFQAHGKLALPATGTGPFTIPLERAMPSTGYYTSVAVLSAAGASDPVDALTVKVIARTKLSVDIIRFAAATGTTASVLAILPA